MKYKNKIEQLIEKRKEIAIKIKELQTERKRLNNHISNEKNREKKRKLNLNLH